MNVILYSTGCPRCNILKEKLTHKNIPFTVNDNAEYMLELGFVSVPVLEVDGTRMDFMEANNWINKQ